MLGNAAGDLGRWEEAAARCAEGLRLTRSGQSAQDRFSIVWALIGLSRVAHARGRPSRAARLLAAALALWSIHPLHPWRWHELDWAVEAVRAQMEAAEYESAWSAGQAAPLEQVIAEALEEALAG